VDASQRLSPGSLITPIEPPHRPPEGLAGDGAARHAVYTTPFCRIEAAVASSRGPQHADNEDAAIDLDGAGRLFIVADGVGGGAMAQTASRLLVAHLQDALERSPPSAERVRQAMLEADRAIAHAIAQRTDLPGAATVVLAAPLDRQATRWLLGWVGDCRAYRLSARGDRPADLLTRDDTFRALGETPPPGSSPDDPARMVGNGATAGANVALLELGADEVLALCSDGVHKYVAAADWQRVAPEADGLAHGCEALIAAARADGSVDDATVLLVRRSGIAPQRRRWIARFGGPDTDAGGPE
jgi:serine/threonine protein phosphatase PrpC